MCIYIYISVYIYICEQSRNLEQSHRLKRKITYVHRYDTFFQGGIAIWKGRIACLVFSQFPAIDVRPLHVKYCRSFSEGSYVMYI